MEAWAFAAALVSALLHAAWNAAVKASREPGETMAAQMIVAGLIAAPALLFTGWPAPPSWPWMLASTLLNLAAVQALLRAYAGGGFGVVYAFVRAVSVLLVVPLAAWFAGEQPGPFALAGVALVCLALACLGVGGGVLLPRTALAWTAAAGSATAAYVICDAQGVRSAGSPWAYAAAMTLVNAASMGLAQQRRGGVRRLLAAHAGRVLPLALAATLSYALILWAYTQAPIARSAALRDTSAVFGLVIAALWLHEPLTRRRLAVLALALAGVACLRI